MSTQKPKRLTRSDLERKVREMEGMLVETCHFASVKLHKAGQDALFGSGVLLTLHALGGREIINPIVIRDGLSADTIEALQRDITRSYTLATTHKPKGVTQ